MLTAAGFATRVRDMSDASSASNSIVRQKRAERVQRLREATRKLVVAWALALACVSGHLSHVFQVCHLNLQSLKNRMSA